MKIGRGIRSTRRKPAPAPLCSPQIPLDETPGGKPATNRLSYGAANLDIYSGILSLLFLHNRLSCLNTDCSNVCSHAAFPLLITQEQRGALNLCQGLHITYQCRSLHDFVESYGRGTAMRTGCRSVYPESRSSSAHSAR
jgi:hypothetical protein